MNKQIILKQQGMTLIELTVVLLILTSLATIALRSTTGLVEQTKWEQTKKRHEEIKKAIIGDPKLVINDQPDISGFVADMGRLPDNIRELLSGEYCDNDYSADETVCASSSPPGNWIKLNPANYCKNDHSIKTADSTNCLPSADWVTTNDKAIQATSTQLGFGWNGPYLTISTSATDKYAVADGWATQALPLPLSDVLPVTGTAELLAVNDYGWNYSVSPVAPIELTLQSYGKDKLLGGTDTYDVDYPSAPIAIGQGDWTVDITGGIDVNIHSFSTQGYCDVSTITSGEACVSAGWKWPGGFQCVNPVTFTEALDAAGLPYADYGACNSVSLLWKWVSFKAGCYAPQNGIGACPITDWVDTSDYCSDPSQISSALCSSASATWYTGNCTYPSIDKTTCAATKKWADCTDTSIATTQSKSVCESHGARWSDVVDVCLNIKYKGLNSDLNQPAIAKGISSGVAIHSADNKTYKFSSFATSTTPPSAISHLSAGKAMFEVKHFVAGACTDLVYPQNFCKGGVTSSQCTTADSKNKWEQACYGVTEVYCVGKGGVFTSATPNICKGITVSECTSATPAGEIKSTCFGEGLNSLPATSCDVLVSSTITIPPVVKTIIPHKAIPQIVW